MTRTTIFIDFDGVLHDVDAGDVEITETGWRVVCKAGFPPLFCHAQILWDLIKEHDVDLVVHSTWRLNHRLEEIRTLLPAPLRYRIVAMTDPTLSRFESIEFYIDFQGVGRYLVIDDDEKSFPKGWEHLVICDPMRGISAPETQDRIRQFLEDAC